MPIRYRDPATIYTPQDMISQVNVIYDGKDKGISIAKINWDDNEVIGIRWNVALREWDEADKMSGVKECLGHPVSRGYPTWFILPREIFDSNSDIVKKVKEVLQKINPQ
ncbi:hypothetical protein [Bergeyella zoohelcum]|uniref:Uncharacterized protein n=1 Tax=Bergeyella zoohelcum TaxID=1015 RepID=A0A376BY81_9FLAO|nr:hypothetical protein [Bergeyella zoohelcum]EKB61312.1 hypothetical protein HMPREF9700_00807 [Bergeyella zoohelcum CCUG 30536]SSZ46596.1 Uncharacterised protein [Bergeyella zoohelcum]